MSISIEHSSPYNKHCLFQWRVYQDNFVRFTGVLPLFFFVLFKYLQTVFMSKMFSQCAFNQCLMQHISFNPFCLPNRNGLLLRYVTVINIAVSLTSPDIAKHLEINKKHYNYSGFNHLQVTNLLNHPAKTSKKRLLNFSRNSSLSSRKTKWFTI